MWGTYSLKSRDIPRLRYLVGQQANVIRGQNHITNLTLNENLSLLRPVCRSALCKFIIEKFWFGLNCPNLLINFISAFIQSVSLLARVWKLTKLNSSTFSIYDTL